MELLDVLDDPVKLTEAKQRACQKVCQQIADLTPEELRDKFERGQQEHGEDFLSIDMQKNMRMEASDSFWYSEGEEHQLRRLT